MTLYNNYLDTAPSQLGSWLEHQRAKLEWDLISKYHTNVGTILELGPGRGKFAEIASSLHVNRYICVEGNHRIASNLYSDGYPVVRCYAPPIPLSDCSVDIVYASHVIEHMPSPLTALELLQEIHRVLRVDGIVTLSAPDILAFGRYFWDADYTHAFPVSQRRIQQIMLDANLTILELGYISGIFTGSVEQLVHFSIQNGLFSLPFLFQKLSIRMQRLKFSFLRNIVVVAQKKND